MSIQYEKLDDVAVFSFDNGELNVVTMAMWKQFYHYFLDFQQDDNITVGLITGIGKNFCAGDDLKEIREEQWALTSTRWDHLLYAARRKKPVIAALNGYVLGGGFLCAMALSDIRVAGRSMQAGAPEIAYGFGGISGATKLASHLAPVDAAYLALTGEKINADRALAMRMVNEVVEDDACLPRAMEIAKLIAKHPRQAVETELDCLHRGMELSRSEAYQYTNSQYWLSRKLMGDNPNTGHDAIRTMKNNKSE